MMPILKQNTQLSEHFLAMVFGHTESLLCYDTLQFDDYSRYLAPRFDAAGKTKRREEIFPQDCEDARALGRRLIVNSQ